MPAVALAVAREAKTGDETMLEVAPEVTARLENELKASAESVDAPESEISGEGELETQCESEPAVVFSAAD